MTSPSCCPLPAIPPRANPLSSPPLAAGHLHAPQDINKDTTWFGSGHQVILGILPALVDVFGDAAKFVRLRRNRLDVARSFAKKGGGPCTHRCIYCLCPLDPVVRCPVSGDVWASLNTFQRWVKLPSCGCIRAIFPHVLFVTSNLSHLDHTLPAVAYPG